MFGVGLGAVYYSLAYFNLTEMIIHRATLKKPLFSSKEQSIEGTPRPDPLVVGKGSVLKREGKVGSGTCLVSRLLLFRKH